MLLERVWVQSLIILTDAKSRVRLNDEQADRVLHLDEAAEYIQEPNRLPIKTESIVRYASQISDAIAQQFNPLRRAREIGDYRVLEAIGKNYLYATLLAEHRLLRTENRFTLKVYGFNIYASQEARRKHEEWILRDANALHRLAGHPNIVQAFLPFPWQDNQIVLPLEWVNGYSLRGLLDAKTEIGFAEKVGIVRQVCEALAFAHKNGVVHRDIRPDNIIVRNDGTAKVVNFDCARVEGDDMQTIATRVGRQLDERYIAPEMWQNAAGASPTSDIYAVGALFFELVTGKPACDRIKEILDRKSVV